MRITVFTPTYNRAYTLTRLYDSLKNQTFHDFEWVIVYDVSTDDTTMVVNRFVDEKPFFPIVYERTENGGKHRAINRGIKHVSGELMLLMDSDDWLREDALELIDNVEKTIPEQEKDSFAGVQGLCAHTDGEIIGKTFEGEVLDTTTIERSKHNITGDKCEVYYTGVMRRYPFPEFEGERFLTEGLVWDKMAADGLKIRYFNEAIYFCEYLEDGLTHGGNMLYARNPKQWGLFIHRNYEYGKEDLFHVMLKIYTYYLFEKSLGMGISEMAENLHFSVPFVYTSIAVQYISDLLRWVLHNKVTVRASVEKEKADAAAQAHSPHGGVFLR